MCILIQIGYTPLHDAAGEGYTEIVDYLVSAGSDLTITNKVNQYVVFSDVQ